MKQKRIIHDTPGYRLEGTVGGNPTTVELFATHPAAQNPRAQRILCLTLPPESLRRAANLFSDAGVTAMLSDATEAPE